MEGMTASILRAGGMLLAFGLAPWAASRALMPRASLAAAIALWGCASTGFAGCVLLLLHASGTPIGAPVAASAYAALVLVFAAVAKARRATWRPVLAQEERPVAVALAAFAAVVVPVTALAGIDTYKWQDLATSVIVERRIAWLVHPLSLFGFTPRSYPSAQPLLLATAQLFGAGVEWGYYLVSLVAGLTGICGMYLLAGCVLGAGRGAAWAALLYGCAPVFIRYTHWATGRGLFLALFPLFLLACMRLPRWRAWVGVAAGSLALALCHKAGGVAVAMVGLAACLAVVLPRAGSRLAAILALAPFAAFAILAAPGSGWHAAVSAARACVMRFGVLLPLAAAGLAAGPAWTRVASRRFVLAGACVALPLACTADAYGALVLAPFATLLAAGGLEAIASRLRPSAVRPLHAAVLALAAGGALATVVHRSMLATPRAVRSAARFLEAYDPRGPFTVRAPTRVQAQVQAYVSGCPRFEVTPDGGARVTVSRPPGVRGQPGAVITAWTRWLREALSLSDTDVAWYGRVPRAYYVTVNGVGERPEGGRVLYDRDGVTVCAPPGQAGPPFDAGPSVEPQRASGL